MPAGKRCRAEPLRGYYDACDINKLLTRQGDGGGCIANPETLGKETMGNIHIFSIKSKVLRERFP
jgi:hypothetical protein